MLSRLNEETTVRGSSELLVLLRTFFFQISSEFFWGKKCLNFFFHEDELNSDLKTYQSLRLDLDEFRTGWCPNPNLKKYISYTNVRSSHKTHLVNFDLSQVLLFVVCTRVQNLFRLSLSS